VYAWDYVMSNLSHGNYCIFVKWKNTNGYDLHQSGELFDHLLKVDLDVLQSEENVEDIILIKGEIMNHNEFKI